MNLSSNIKELLSEFESGGFMYNVRQGVFIIEKSNNIIKNLEEISNSKEILSLVELGVIHDIVVLMHIYKNRCLSNGYDAGEYGAFCLEIYGKSRRIFGSKELYI